MVGAFSVSIAILLGRTLPHRKKERATMEVGRARREVMLYKVQNEGTRCVMLTVHAGPKADRCLNAG
jgi:hypothetical protein